MILLSLLEISKQYDTKVLLKDCHLSIDENEKIAIIGKNGCGKSTLLQIIDGSISQDSGKRIMRNDIQILSLKQHIHFDPHYTVEKILQSSFYDLENAHKRLHEIACTPNFIDNEILNQEYNRITNYIDRHNGWDLESKIDLIKQSFGLEKFSNRLASSLSGGEQKRVALASLLIKSADIIVLDEPTNHLDVEMIKFLERYIKNMKTSVVFISHDRCFIDSVATRIIEIHNAKLYNFSGGYLAYLQTKQRILQNMEKENELLKKILKTEEKWLQQGIQARRKRNEGRKERLLALRAKVKSMPKLVKDMSQTLEKTLYDLPKITVKNTKKMIFELTNFSLYVNNKLLIHNLNIRIMQQERLAIVGKNGCGKSTFLKSLIGDNPAILSAHRIHYDGIVRRGDVKIGYFDQHKTMLDDSKTLIETFCPNGGDRVNVRGKNIHVYGYLKGFLFPQDDLEKKIGMLSGGEKSRVALALLFTKEYDCLILDEPTNDLDIATMNILEKYLQSYECAIIFVSHDRYFVDKIAKRLLVLQDNNAEPHHIITYAKYNEFLDIQDELEEIHSIQNLSPQDNVDSITHIKNNSHTIQKPKKLSYKEKLEYEKLEEEIPILETRIKMLEHQLSIPSEYEKYGIHTLSKELEIAMQNLQYKWQRYEELCLKTETL